MSKFRTAISFCAFLACSSAAADTEPQRAYLASNLFGIPLGEIDHAARGANYSYNNWGDDPGSPGRCNAYDGGHSGIDIQTKDVAGDRTTDRPFFAISAGEVIESGGDDYNTIAIYDRNNDVTTIYLHARRLDVSVGQHIALGMQLGIQGDEGANGAEHVHFESRSGRQHRYACGAADASSVDPVHTAINYFVDYLTREDDYIGSLPLDRGRTLAQQVVGHFEGRVVAVDSNGDVPGGVTMNDEVSVDFAYHTTTYNIGRVPEQGAVGYYFPARENQNSLRMTIDGTEWVAANRLEVLVHDNRPDGGPDSVRFASFRLNGPQESNRENLQFILSNQSLADLVPSSALPRSLADFRFAGAVTPECCFVGILEGQSGQPGTPQYLSWLVVIQIDRSTFELGPIADMSRTLGTAD